MLTTKAKAGITVAYQKTIHNSLIYNYLHKLILHRGAAKITKYVEVTLSYVC